VPALSAVKVGGERLHRRTRRGETSDLPERDIVIHAADVVAIDPAAGWVDLEIACSKGTYVRQVAVDLGETLGCGGYCEELRRTAVGCLSVDEAVAPENVRAAGGIDPRRALPLPERVVSVDEARDVLHGRPVNGTGDGPVALVAGGELLAIAHPVEGGRLQPRVVLG
jgi:tRNA pseudouridine55 synthase